MTNKKRVQAKMGLKKVYLILLIVLLLFINTTIAKSLIQSLTDTDWMKLYREFLHTQLEDAFVTDIKLVDLDIDNIPELIIEYGGGNAASEGFHVFRINDQQVQAVYKTEIDGAETDLKLYRDKDTGEKTYIKSAYYGCYPGFNAFGKTHRTLYLKIHYNQGNYAEEPIYAVEYGYGHVNDNLELYEIILQMNEYYGGANYLLSDSELHEKWMNLEVCYLWQYDELKPVPKSQYEEEINAYYKNLEPQICIIPAINGIDNRPGADDTSKVLRDKDITELFRSYNSRD